MSDGELIMSAARGEKRWLGVILALREMQARTLGKAQTAVQWLPAEGLGNFGWLGFYWESPPFWFGFGLRDSNWLPLIECDVRRCGAAYVEQLEASLPSTWSEVDRFGGQYWRLWAPVSVQGDMDLQLAWLSERSRELHEFTVSA